MKGTINARINILYLLDSLCEASLLSKANSNVSGTLYVDYVTKDLGKIVNCVVPEGREGLVNLTSAVQVSLRPSVMYTVVFLFQSGRILFRVSSPP